MPVIEFAEESLFAWLEQKYPRITRRYNRDEMVVLRKQFMQDNPGYAIKLTLMRQEFLRLLARESDYDADIVAEQGFDVFFHARQQVTFYDDVLPCLQRLKQSYRLGSVSNGNASVEHVGLGDMIEHSVSAADINVAKGSSMSSRKNFRHPRNRSYMLVTTLNMTLLHLKRRVCSRHGSTVKISTGLRSYRNRNFRSITCRNLKFCFPGIVEPALFFQHAEHCV